MAKRGINKSIVSGNLGDNPVSKPLPNGSVVTTFSIATSETYKDSNGQKKEETEWHEIACYGKLAEICAQYLSKGSQVLVEGRMKTSRWTDANGSKQRKTQVVIDEMQMLGGGSGQNQGQNNQQGGYQSNQNSGYQGNQSQGRKGGYQQPQRSNPSDNMTPMDLDSGIPDNF